MSSGLYVSKVTGAVKRSRAARWPSPSVIRRLAKGSTPPSSDTSSVQVVWRDAQGRYYGTTDHSESTWYVYTPRRKDGELLEKPELDVLVPVVRAFDVLNSRAVLDGRASAVFRLIRLETATEATRGHLRSKTLEYYATVTRQQKLSVRGHAFLERVVSGCDATK